MNYIIPAFLAFLVGLLLWVIKRERKSMSYEVIESEIFPREQGNGKYFVIKFKNNGNRPVETINLKINFDSGSIESVTFSNPNLVTDLEKEPSYLKGVIPFLNPHEKLQITITSIGKDVISSPQIVARGIGVTALPNQGDLSRHYMTIIGIGVGLLSGVFTYQLITIKKTETQIKTLTQNLPVIKEDLEKDKKLNKLDKEFEDLKSSMEKENKESQLGKPQSEQIIFGILNRSGLGQLIPDLISTGESLAYWKTGLYLLHHFLIDQKNGKKYLNAMEELIKVEMMPSSRGFNLYLLGKMEQFIGNHSKAYTYFDMCKNGTPLMYEHLMLQDPSYDLSSLRQWLLKSQGLKIKGN